MAAIIDGNGRGISAKVMDCDTVGSLESETEEVSLDEIGAVRIGRTASLR